MYLPKLQTDIAKTKKYIISFGGINRTGNAREGELWDCGNLSADETPYLYPSGEKESIAQFTSPTCVFAFNGLYVLDGTELKYKGETDAEFTVKMTLTAGQKQLAQVGDYICIFPDKKYYDVKNQRAGDIAGSIYVSKWEKKDGTQENRYQREEYWTVTHKAITIYNKTDDRGDGTHYMSADEILAGYKAGDYFTMRSASIDDEIEGAADVFTNLSDSSYICLNKVENEVIRAITSSSDRITLTFDDGTFFSSSNRKEYYGVDGFYVKRDMPELEYICGSGGRLWGVAGNTIYASEYMQPYTFGVYEGLASDSYYIDVASPGEWTGCAEYLNHICFFKENCIHKIYGNRPTVFSLVTSNVPGVQKGSSASIVTINEVMYYKGTDNIYGYAGGTPQPIAYGLGNEKYTDAAAGKNGGKYYISMKDSGGEYSLFCYDTQKRILLREDNTRIVSAADDGGNLYIANSGGGLLKIAGGAARDKTEWYALLCEFSETVNEKKGYSRLQIRYDMEAGAYFNIEVSTDRGRFRLVKTVNKPGQRSVCVPLPPNRCDSFRVRLSGKGECRIKDMVREFTTESEV